MRLGYDALITRKDVTKAPPLSSAGNFLIDSAINHVFSADTTFVVVIGAEHIFVWVTLTASNQPCGDCKVSLYSLSVYGSEVTPEEVEELGSHVNLSSCHELIFDKASNIEGLATFEIQLEEYSTIYAVVSRAGRLQVSSPVRYLSCFISPSYMGAITITLIRPVR